MNEPNKGQLESQEAQLERRVFVRNLRYEYRIHEEKGYRPETPETICANILATRDATIRAEAAAQLAALTAELGTVRQCNAANILELSRADERIGALTAERDEAQRQERIAWVASDGANDVIANLRAELARCHDRLESLRRILAPVLELETRAELNKRPWRSWALTKRTEVLSADGYHVLDTYDAATAELIAASVSALPELRAELEKP
jgi:hypothetical protein